MVAGRDETTPPRQLSLTPRLVRGGEKFAFPSSLRRGALEEGGVVRMLA
jgi:hypothetical protein